MSFGGDVAVAHRRGGLTKIYARLENCVDRTGCRGSRPRRAATTSSRGAPRSASHWYTEFPATNQRTVAYTQGRLNPATRKYEDTKVWTVTSATPGLPSAGGPGGVIAHRVNDDSGAIEDTVDIPELDGSQLGAYGGAVDPFGNRSFVPMGSLLFGAKYLAKVDGVDLSYELCEMPPNINSYAVTVDQKGRAAIPRSRRGLLRS